MENTKFQISQDRRGVSTIVIAVIIVAIVAVAAVGISMITSEKAGTIKYDVVIDNLEEVEVFIFVDDKEIFHEKITDYGKHTRGRTFNYALSGDSAEVILKAILKDSSGTIIDEDSKAVTVVVNEITETITLRVSDL